MYSVNQEETGKGNAKKKKNVVYKTCRLKLWINDVVVDKDELEHTEVSKNENDKEETDDQVIDELELDGEELVGYNRDAARNE